MNCGNSNFICVDIDLIQLVEPFLLYDFQDAFITSSPRGGLHI